MVTGLSHIHSGAFLQPLCAALNLKAVILTADEAEAARLCDDLSSFGVKSLLLPARDLTLRSFESASREFEQQRLGVLARMAAGDFQIVVAGIDAAVQHTLPPSALHSRTFTIKAGAALPVKDLAAALAAAGYERCEQVEARTVRGARRIYDIFPPTAPLPFGLSSGGTRWTPFHTTT